MFTLSPGEAAVLGLGVAATIMLVVAAALRGIPRSSRIATATVRCPLLNRKVNAELEWDDWGLRFIDVTRCAVLGNCAKTNCSRGCIRVTR